jgi:signal transduction histidine kinase
MIQHKKPYTPEMLIPRIGEYLVELGIITSQHLAQALEIQKNGPPDSDHEILGKILVDMGVISQSQLDEIVTEQILSLRKASERNNRMLERRVQERTAELEEALRKINELNQLKTNFIANISHELRSPLTHIKGYLELLTSKDLGELAEDQMKVLTIMDRSANRLERLIEDLILFTFAENDEVLIIQREFDLLPVIYQNIDHFKTSSPFREFSINIVPESPSLWVVADEKKISWVINHLIENAAKFSAVDKAIQINIFDKKDHVQIQIKDEGIGIPENRMQEIFEPFHQLDGSSTRRYGGIGLGLALAKKILSAHNQPLNVQSEIGIGSQFDFSLRKLIE